MGVEVGAVAPQNVHQQQFRGELRGGHLMGEKSLESLPKCGAEKHGIADCRLAIVDLLLSIVEQMRQIENR